MDDTFWTLFIQMTAAVLLSLQDTLLKWLSSPLKRCGGGSLTCLILPPGATPTLAAHSSTLGLTVPALGYLMLSRSEYWSQG